MNDMTGLTMQNCSVALKKQRRIQSKAFARDKTKTSNLSSFESNKQVALCLFAFIVMETNWSLFPLFLLSCLTHTKNLKVDAYLNYFHILFGPRNYYKLIMDTVWHRLCVRFLWLKHLIRSIKSKCKNKIKYWVYSGKKMKSIKRGLCYN